MSLKNLHQIGQTWNAHSAGAPAPLSDSSNKHWYKAFSHQGIDHQGREARICRTCVLSSALNLHHSVYNELYTT